MTARHVEVLRDELGGAPGNKRVKVLRAVFKWAVKADVARANPAKDAEFNRVVTEGFTPWTAEDVLAFEARHPIGTKARLALALFLYTGQRVSDVASFGPLNFRGGRLVYVQHKGRRQKIKRRSLPLVRPLSEILATSPLGATTWLETEQGKPFSINGLGNKMRQWCDEAGLTELSAHGIRKATGIMAAERGCTAHQIMEMLGHDTLQEAERYTKAADAKRLADDGFSRTFGGES
jgi:integrase